MCCFFVLGQDARKACSDSTLSQVRLGWNIRSNLCRFMHLSSNRLIFRIKRWNKAVASGLLEHHLYEMFYQNSIPS